MRNFVADRGVLEKLNNGQCGTKDCNEKPTHAIFIIESLDQSNLLGVACDEHKDVIGDLFGQLGVMTHVQTEPIETFRKRIVGA